MEHNIDINAFGNLKEKVVLFIMLFRKSDQTHCCDRLIANYKEKQDTWTVVHRSRFS